MSSRGRLATEGSAFVFACGVTYTPCPPPPPKLLVFIGVGGIFAQLLMPKELETKVVINKELGGCFRKARQREEGKSEARRQRTGPFTGQGSQFKTRMGVGTDPSTRCARSGFRLLAQTPAKRLKTTFPSPSIVEFRWVGGGWIGRRSQLSVTRRKAPAARPANHLRRRARSL